MIPTVLDSVVWLYGEQIFWTAFPSPPLDHTTDIKSLPRVNLVHAPTRKSPNLSLDLQRRSTPLPLSTSSVAALLPPAASLPWPPATSCSLLLLQRRLPPATSCALPPTSSPSSDLPAASPTSRGLQRLPCCVADVLSDLPPASSVTSGSLPPFQNLPIAKERSHMTGYFVVDFTLAELKSLGVKQRFSFGDQQYNDAIALDANRIVGIYPEIKDPVFINLWVQGK
ncbi:uncharacterized protein LOC122012433 isoform X2 [Zingiber officinale]|uniref:uncharacterized protein LOC122012433 isoform X2 n=1 Tax=Zingiber officinale TaxID=94328 RepID=UPI001C4D94FA|nr:uncharacterized protein LOC122012433 isoform X2 [Zingiber officinale]